MRVRKVRESITLKYGGFRSFGVAGGAGGGSVAGGCLIHFLRVGIAYVMKVVQASIGRRMLLSPELFLS